MHALKNKREYLHLFPWRGRVGALSAAVLLALGLGGCAKPVEKVEEIRPVRATRVQVAEVNTVAEYAGEIRPRVESRLGFRVGGKIVSRKVDVGSTVKRGQLLMQLDPQDLKLAQEQARAGLRSAESNRDLARAELKRYQDLREKNFVSQAVLDSKETAYKAAQASYEQAVASLRNQTNQADYASLISDVDGVVTGIDAEAGQVVAAGTPVVRVAQAGDKEIVIGIPEDRIDEVRQSSDIRVRTWANQNTSFAGKLRELSPVADPTTRTYTAKISIPDAPQQVRLGMTAYVAFSSRNSQSGIHVPLTAVFKGKDGSAVWIVENGAVRQVPVQISGATGDQLLIKGVTPGQVLVTGGVNLLKPGQKVKILGDDAVSVNATTPVAPEAAPGSASVSGAGQ